MILLFMAVFGRRYSIILTSRCGKITQRYFCKEMITAEMVTFFTISNIRSEYPNKPNCINNRKTVNIKGKSVLQLFLPTILSTVLLCKFSGV